MELQEVAYGFLKLTPGEFWCLTIGQFAMMIEARQQYERRDRSHRANEILASVVGYRARKPNLKKLYRDLVGDEDRPLKDMPEYASMIAESRARVAAQKKRSADGNGR